MMHPICRILCLLLSLVPTWQPMAFAAIAVQGTYTGTGPNSSGAGSVTDVTIPSGVSIAVVSMHWYDSSGDGPGSITLDGQTCTTINSVNTSANNAVLTCWATGMASGASKTLAYTNSAFLTSGVGVRICFLSGTPTSSPLRHGGSANASNNGNVDFSGMTFSSGDFTVIATTSDNAGVLLDGGANTQCVAESASDGLQAGIAYRTDGGAIGTPSSTNSFLGASAFVVQATGGGGGGTVNRLMLLGVGP